jgi:hypothetical protein
VKDAQPLGQLLGLLGKSRLANNLNQLAKAANMGSLPVTQETESDLREACAAVFEMRLLLLKALGLKILEEAVQYRTPLPEHFADAAGSVWPMILKGSQRGDPRRLAAQRLERERQRRGREEAEEQALMEKLRSERLLAAEQRAQNIRDYVQLAVAIAVGGMVGLVLTPPLGGLYLFLTK